jgi:septal ring factor EnvC (AmiA/AmiB activator)
MADTTHPPTSTLDYPTGGEDAGHHRRSGARGAAILSVILALVIVALAVMLSKETETSNHTRQQLDQANATAAQEKSQLTAAQSQVTDLQSQVSAAKQQQAGAQAQLTKAQAQATGLQQQLARSQSALQSAQQQSQSQVADLQGQLKQNESSLAGLRHDLDQANGQVNDLKAQLAQAKSASAPPAAAAIAELRDLPLKSEFHKGFLSSKYSLELKNTGSAPVSVSVQSGTAAPQMATIKGGDSYKMSDLAAGANVTVQSDGFKPLNLTAR